MIDSNVLLLKGTMFFKNYAPTIVENTKKFELVCSHCGNKGANQIYEFYDGICVGFIFINKPIISKKRYVLICPVCNNPNRELSLKEVQNTMGQGIIKEADQTNTSSNSFCMHCGNSIKDNYLFCKNCGTKL